MIRDQETIKQLVDLIERFVRERLVPNEERLAPKAGYLMTFSKK